MAVQVTLEEFTALMTGAIGGRDPMQVQRGVEDSYALTG